ncbi:hypothetical protein ACFYNO_07075 [Kitasatospora sp. NPDC006697]|uniref:hypothetical protein n=1 Tax=Kitasatospora sp. NPDC006697 TaxID=3364020 RepID=UPI0036BB0158
MPGTDGADATALISEATVKSHLLRAFGKLERAILAPGTRRRPLAQRSQPGRGSPIAGCSGASPC